MKKINLLWLKKGYRNVTNWIRRHDAEVCFAGAALFGTAAIVTAVDAGARTKTALDIQRGIIADELNKTVDEKERKKKLAELYFKTGMKVVSNWAPTALLTVSAYGLGYKGYSCMRTRVNNATALAESTAKSFNAYRSNVVDKFGVDVDKELITGTIGGVLKEITKEEVDEKTGEVKTSTEKVLTVDPNNLPALTYLFTKDTSTGSEDCYDMDAMFVQCQVAYMSDLLAVYGVYTVHEAEQLLGFKRNSKEKDWGWRYPKSHRVNVEWKKVYIGDTDKPYNAANNRVLVTIKPDYIDVWNDKDPKPVRKELINE